MLSFKLFGRLCHTSGTSRTIPLMMQCSARMASTDSPMATLRRRTGYAFSLCRQALELHGQDLTRAEQWLKAEAAKQGWERAQRVAQRATGDGLVGVLTQTSTTTGQTPLAAMIEVNCETDFVARNELFSQLTTRLCHQLANRYATTGATQHTDTDTLVSRVRLSLDQLLQLSPELVVEAIGKLGENIRLTKACLISAGSLNEPDVHLIGYTHAVGGKAQSGNEAAIETILNDKSGAIVQLGKYGAIVVLKCHKLVNESGDDVTKSDAEIQEIGKQLAQHIIGLKPKTIEAVARVKSETTTDNTELGPEAYDMDGSRESEALLEQQFIFDEDLTVGQYLKDHNIKVLDFVRYECGIED
ncbi:elongation factor Ts, mitochondrial-like [Oppia nitens]|uniref:elongation factor Ts, mitochondrial-like n=1 Tax=Oppia nitens TaxID=1686743 RepID=UPI0023DA6A5B|nr:elongation factor Ts, mitochondrial-like [Oppia nitens]